MNMLLFWLFAPALCSMTYALKDYKIIMKGVKVVAVNPENVECEAFMSRTDRYTTAVNIFLRLKLDLPSHYKILLKGYEFLNNEYRPFAVHLERSFCSFLEFEYKKFVYPECVRHGAKMLQPKCPILKGNYSVYNYIPSIESLPMGLPFKNLLLEFKVLNGTNIDLHLHFYVILDRDAFIRERYS